MVTIVVLLILAAISITALIGENGLITRAKLAAEKTNQSVQNDIVAMDELNQQIEELINKETVENTPGGNKIPKVSDNLGKVISTTENTDLTDSLGNKITVPAGFYIVTPSQDSTVIYDYLGDEIPTVQDGIVIQNQEDGNQFVWIPIGTINNKEEDEKGASTTIKLGRYSDFTMNETTLPTLAQEATLDSSNTPVIINNYYFEVSDTFIGDINQNLNAASSYGNTKALNLQ